MRWSTVNSTKRRRTTAPLINAASQLSHGMRLRGFALNKHVAIDAECGRKGRLYVSCHVPTTYPLLIVPKHGVICTTNALDLDVFGLMPSAAELKSLVSGDEQLAAELFLAYALALQCTHRLLNKTALVRWFDSMSSQMDTRGSLRSEVASTFIDGVKANVISRVHQQLNRYYCVPPLKDVTRTWEYVTSSHLVLEQTSDALPNVELPSVSVAPLLDMLVHADAQATVTLGLVTLADLKELIVPQPANTDEERLEFPGLQQHLRGVTSAELMYFVVSAARELDQGSVLGLVDRETLDRESLMGIYNAC